MSPEEIRKRVERIREMAGDDEAAHSEEDSLHQEVLAAIRDGQCEGKNAECAGLALETLSIDFARWCA